MKSLLKYINEARTQTDDDVVKVINKFLRGKNYDDYVATIEKMLQDEQTRAMLIDGFGGKLGTMRFRYSTPEIVAKKLRPTQSELDLDKSLKYALTDIYSAEETFEEPIIINKPIITFNKKYVIDGHHTWLQAMALNPNAKMFCFNYDAKIEPIEMLKAVQGVIAAVKAENKNKQNKLQHLEVGQHDLYKMSKQEIYDYIKHTITRDCKKYLSEQLRVADTDNLAKVICDNLKITLKNNAPISDAPERKNMPQVWDGGLKDDDIESAEPVTTGSAMNKLKDKKITKTAIK